MSAPRDDGTVSARVRFQLVPGRRMNPSAPESAVGWRLLGANNRVLARSAELYPDERRARAAVERLRSTAPDLLSEVRVEGRGWRWEVGLRLGIVAVAARTFRSRREAWANLRQFLALLPAARPPDSVVGEVSQLPGGAHVEPRSCAPVRTTT